MVSSYPNLEQQSLTLRQANNLNHFYAIPWQHIHCLDMPLRSQLQSPVQVNQKLNYTSPALWSCECHAFDWSKAHWFHTPSKPCSEACGLHVTHGPINTHS